MHWPDTLRQIARLATLGTVREQRARAAYRRAIAQRDAAAQRLRDIEHALQVVEAERRALSEDFRGMTTRAGLFEFKRRESALERRRIDLALDGTTYEDARADAAIAAQQAMQRATAARHRHDKLTHVLTMFRQRARREAQRREDDTLEELP